MPRGDILRCLLRSVRAAELLALAGLASAACGANASVPLSRTFDSPEQAARTVLDGIAGRNLEALIGLALDEREFRQVVWPELPSSRPEAGLPVEYAWRQLDQRSRAQLSLILAEHGGKRYELLAVDVRGDTTRYDRYTAHRRTELVVRDPAGAVQTIRLFGSLLERNGTWKIFSYVVD